MAFWRVFITGFFIPSLTLAAVELTDEALAHRLAQGRAIQMEAKTLLRESQERLSASMPFTCQGRLTVVSGTPVPVTDQANATALYFTPYQGSRVSLYDGSKWVISSFTERTLTLSGLTANTNYDIFLYNNAGTLTLSTTAWASDTARATALTTQDGVYVKTGALTYRYLGTIRMTSTTQTQDTATQRFVWNYYNRVWRHMLRQEATTTWTYVTTAYRATNNNSGTNLLEYVVGVVESIVPLTCHLMMSGSAAVADVGNAYNINTTTSSATDVARGGAVDTLIRRPNQCFGIEYASIGYRPVQWIEAGNAWATTTYASAPNAKVQGGMLGMIQN